MTLRNPIGTKFAVISHILPPSGSGQSVVLYRLLRGIDSKRFCLISRVHYKPDNLEETALPWLRASYHHLRSAFGAKYLRRFGVSGTGDWIETVHRGRQISRILKSEHCEAVISCSGDPYDLPAGYLASRWSGARFYAYLFDDYLHQWTDPSDRHMAEKWEKTLIEGADGVIVPNEFLAEAYRDRYRVQLTVIHNPCEEADDRSLPVETWPADPKEVKIIYTGAIYSAHYDSFRNLLEGIQQIDKPEITLHLFTSQSFSELESRNIRGRVMVHPPLPIERTTRIQKEADILFLALAFHSPFPEIIRTSAPGKMGEYLSSGKPVLVHAPPDCFVTSYFKERQCGLVVEKNDPAALADAVKQLLEDNRLRETVVRNGMECAKRDFNLRQAREKFLNMFQSEKGEELCASSS